MDEPESELSARQVWAEAGAAAATDADSAPEEPCSLLAGC